MAKVISPVEAPQGTTKMWVSQPGAVAVEVRPGAASNRAFIENQGDLDGTLSMDKTPVGQLVRVDGAICDRETLNRFHPTQRPRLVVEVTADTMVGVHADTVSVKGGDLAELRIFAEPGQTVDLSRVTTTNRVSMEARLTTRDDTHALTGPFVSTERNHWMDTAAPTWSRRFPGLDPLGVRYDLEVGTERGRVGRRLQITGLQAVPDHIEGQEASAPVEFHEGFTSERAEASGKSYLAQFTHSVSAPGLDAPVTRKGGFSASM